MFRKNVFHEKCFWMVLLSVGVQRSEDRIEKPFLGPLFLNRESLSKWSSFWKVWYKWSTGYSGMMKVLKNYNSGEVVFLKTFSMENFFERQSSQWRYRGPTLKRKFYNLEKMFFSLKDAFAKKIRLVFYDSSLRVHTTKDEKYSFRKKNFPAECF